MPKRSDLVLLPFPSSDLSSAKRRPVLVLRSPNRQGDFLAAQVTSQLHHQPGPDTEQDPRDRLAPYLIKSTRANAERDKAPKLVELHGQLEELFILIRPDLNKGQRGAGGSHGRRSRANA